MLCSYAGDATEKKSNNKSNKNGDQETKKTILAGFRWPTSQIFSKKMSYPDDGTRDNKTTSKY